MPTSLLTRLRRFACSAGHQSNVTTSNVARPHVGGVAAVLLGGIMASTPGSLASAQENDPGAVDIAFNRYYDTVQTEEHLRAIADAYPELVELRTIGTSLGGRPMLLAIVTAPENDHADVPGMWIDGNVHGNEIQASEVVLYSLWYLTKEYGRNERITELLKNSSFYLMPMVNPDGRQNWFDAPNSPSSSRANIRPIDDDRDGLIDEDPPNDLDGDGSITQMWIRDPDGGWIRDTDDPRVFRRVGPGKKGAWSRLGSEGIDDDGDGRTNEDGISGDDMNRNWPGDFQPTFIQRGAGPYALSAPETRAVAEFIVAHPNIAAGQSYHNTGGMLLRGPGTDYMEGAYPRPDVAVYDELGELGAAMMPGYRYLVIFADLYNVHGGFVTWLSESLGVIAFTNELWSSEKYFYQAGEGRDPQAQQWLWRDRIAFGDVFTDYTEVEHPEHGTVLVGGPNKWSSRSTPTFMLEEECHRNFAFTMLHADEMPIVRFERPVVKQISQRQWEITVAIANEKLIPTRTARARQVRSGRPDVLTAEGGGIDVLATSLIGSRRDTQLGTLAPEPGRVVLSQGIPGRGQRIVRMLVEGRRGATLNLSYTSEKARDIELSLRLRVTEPEG
ncbi:MAG: M14 family metallopeptidase [Phycisphaerales bacterium]